MHSTEDGSAASVPDPESASDEGFDDRPAGAEIVAVGVVALIAGAVLRFATTSSLWLDESLSVNIARLPAGDIVRWLRHDGHPPLYYLLLHVWTDVFGTGDVAVRALSGVFGLLTLPLAWIAGRRRGGPVLGWLTVIVVALSPFAVRYSDEARMYSMVTFLAFAGYLLLDDVLRRSKGGVVRLVGIALIATALLYTHYWAIWLLAAAGLMVLWRAFRAPERADRLTAWKVAGALVVGGLLFVPWLPSMLYQSAHTGTPWASPMRPPVAMAETLQSFSSGLYADSAFFAVLVGLFIVLGVFGRARDGRHIELDLRTRPQLRAEALVAVLTFGIGIVMAYAARGAFAARYAAVFFPFVALLIAGGVTRFAARWVRFGALLVLCAFLGIGALWNVADTRTQAGQVGAAVDANATPGDLVVYCPDQLGPAGSRVVTADVQQVTYPTFGDPAFVDWVDYKERNDAADPVAFAQQVLAEAPPSRGIFVVWSSDYKTFEGDCEALVNTIGAARPGQEVVTKSSRFFEGASVSWFPATS
jgi:mannosyltransferase